MNGIIVGIDPGASGGIARICGTELEVWPLPWITGAGINPEPIRSLLLTADHLVIEEASVRPGQSVVAVKSTIGQFWRLVGLAEGLSVPYTLVRPQTWQLLMLAGTPRPPKGFSPPERRAAIKRASVAIAQRLWPACSFLPTPRCSVPSDGMAEAALIAEWGRRTLNARP